MDIAERPPLMRWTVERFMALVESGVIPERRGIELLDGQVVTERPQGKLHFLLFLALQHAFEAMEAAKHGLVTQPTILFEGDNALDPEFALLRAEYGVRDLPRPKDVRLVVEVSVTSIGYDLGGKKRTYAESGIPNTGSSTFYAEAFGSLRIRWAATTPRRDSFLGAVRSRCLWSVGP